VVELALALICLGLPGCLNREPTFLTLLGRELTLHLTPLCSKLPGSSLSTL
jgi:hypothetical protein